MFSSFIIIGILLHQIQGCTDNSDCSYLGYCDLTTSKCICNQGWYGNNCDIINLKSTINYNIDGYHDLNGLATWDGSPILDSNTGLYHLYISILTENCTPGNRYIVYR